MVGNAEIKATVTAEDQTGQARKNVESGFKNMVANINTALIQAGSAFSNLGNKLTQNTNAMIEGFAGFDQAMMNTISIAQGTETEFNALREQAQALSQEMPASAEQIAQGYYTLASAGIEANKILELTPDILKLSTATASDFDTTAKVLTSSLMVFADQELTASEASEILMNTVKGFKTTLPELADSLAYSGSIASQTGVSFAELSTATGILRNAGMEASQAGTAMRMMLIQLIAPSGEAQEVMARYGIEIAKNADGTLDLVGTLRNMNQALENTDPIEKASVLTTILGARATSAGDALMKNADQLEILAESATRAGSVEEAFGKQLEGAQYQLDISTNKVEEAQMALSEKMVPAQIRANEATAGFYNALSKLPDPLLEVGGAITVLAGKIMTSVGNILQLATSIMTLITLRGIHATAIGAETTAETWNTSVKAGNTAVTVGFTTATLASTTATEGATVAQWAHNVAMYASPIFIMIGAVVALTLGLKALADATRKSSAEYQEISQEIENTTLAIENQEKAIENLDDTLGDLQAEYNALQLEMDTWNVENMIAQDRLDELNALLETETDDMRALGAEIENLKTSQNDLEGINRDLNLSIEQNNLAIRDHERSIQESVLSLSSYKNAISDASAELEILSGLSTDNSQAQMENNIEIAKLNAQIKPLERARAELENKQKSGITLTGTEIGQMASLTAQINDLEAQILTYKDSNDELRLAQMELSLAQSEARKSMADAEDIYTQKLQEATADDLAEIDKLKTENQDYADQVALNVATINGLRDEQLDKEKELAEMVPELTAEQQAEYDELTQKIITNNGKIDDNRLAQAELKLTIDETTASLNAEREALENLNAELETLNENLEYAGKPYSDEEEKRLFDQGYSKVTDPESGQTIWMPSWQSGVDKVPRDTTAYIHKDETVLNRESAGAFRELMGFLRTQNLDQGATARGGNITLNNTFNVSHPDAGTIINEIERLLESVKNDIRNERLREGVGVL